MTPDKARKPRHRKSKRTTAPAEPPASTGTESGRDTSEGRSVVATWFTDEPTGTAETRLVLDSLRARADGTIGGRRPGRS